MSKRLLEQTRAFYYNEPYINESVEKSSINNIEKHAIYDLINDDDGDNGDDDDAININSKKFKKIKNENIIILDNDYENEDEIIVQLARAFLNFDDNFSFGKQHKIEETIEINYLDKFNIQQTLSLPSNLYNYNEATNSTVMSTQLLKLIHASNINEYEPKSTYSYENDRLEGNNFGNYIKGDKIVSVKGLFIDEILTELKNNLFTDENNISANLIELNIFTKGGYFEETYISSVHPIYETNDDAPDKVIGSLIIVLPTAHSGGTLTVKFKDEIKSYDCSKKFTSVPKFDLYEDDEDNSLFKELIKNGHYRTNDGDENPWNNGKVFDLDEAKKNNNKREMLIECGNTNNVCSFVSMRSDFVTYAMDVDDKVVAGVRLSLKYDIVRSDTKSASILPILETSKSLEPIIAPLETIEIISNVIESSIPAHLPLIPTGSSLSREKNEYEPDLFWKREKQDEFSRMTVEQLKSECRRKGLLLKGRSHEIQARLRKCKEVEKFNDIRQKITYMNPNECSKRAKHFCQLLFEKVIKNPNFYPIDGIVLAFPCFHINHDNDIPNIQVINNKELESKDLKLKGRDAILTVIAAKLGLHSDIRRLIYLEPYSRWKECMSNLPNPTDAADIIGDPKLIVNNVFKLGVDVSKLADFKSDCVTMGNPPTKHNMKFSFSIPDFVNGAIDRDIIPRCKVLETFMSICDDFIMPDSYKHGSIFAQCVMIIKIPPFHDRLKLNINDCLEYLSPDIFSNVIAGQSAENEQLYADKDYEINKNNELTIEQLQILCVRKGMTPRGTKKELERKLELDIMIRGSNAYDNFDNSDEANDFMEYQRNRRDLFVDNLRNRRRIHEEDRDCVIS